MKRIGCILSNRKVKCDECNYNNVWDCAKFHNDNIVEDILAEEQ